FITLMTMMLPGQVTLVPQFILFRDLNWVNTYWPLVVPAFFGNPFYIFLIRQFMLTIPGELEEAARIDGASSLHIFTRIFVPLASPALVASIIFSFMFHWNDFFGPLVYLNSDSLKTLALGLAAFKGEFTNQWHLLMAGSVMMLLPCVAVFFFAQRYFIEGVVMTGLKE
ncbi:MAG TPA: carbohydrate ABC transporter permease, partial [Chloroflexota bacterium]|nr:carbohydrate ABC transporter permease [Chloroflexota bacterium]